MRIHKVHKWVAITVGVVILTWFLSGILIILKPFPSDLSQHSNTHQVDFEEITVSPAKAVANLAVALGVPLSVTSINLSQIQEVLAYTISLQSGDSHLVDASSGQVFMITAGLAAQIARDEFSDRAPIVENTRQARHDFSHLVGPLPVYRIVFSDDRATISYVNVDNGSVRRTDRWSRLQSKIMHLHTFNTFVINQNRLRKSLLLLLSVVGIGAVGTGYYLALRRRKRTR